MARFSVASALLALLNIELPLEARPPIPSPLGLCNRTKRIKTNPVPIHIQERIDVIIFRQAEADEKVIQVFL